MNLPKCIAVVLTALLMFSQSVAAQNDTRQTVAASSTSEQQQPALEQEEDDPFAEYNQTENVKTVADPLYYFNYAMYGINDFLYFYALKPIAQGYKFVVPTPARKGIKNFFHNLMFPVRFINCLLQGKVNAAGEEFSAFFVNSTVGILGFNDFAQKHMNLAPHVEDLGQTLATYHIGDGFYLVLPILGPSTLRDSVGMVGDYFATPLNYVKPWELTWGLKGLDTINATSFRIGDYEALKAASLEPYVAIRNAYIQHRQSLIKQ